LPFIPDPCAGWSSFPISARTLAMRAGFDVLTISALLR